MFGEISVLKFTKCTRPGHIKAFVTVCIAGLAGLIIEDIYLLEKDDEEWLNFPTRSYHDGKEMVYQKILTFQDLKVENLLKKQILDSIYNYLIDLQEGCEESFEVMESKENSKVTKLKWKIV